MSIIRRVAVLSIATFSCACHNSLMVSEPEAFVASAPPASKINERAITRAIAERQTTKQLAEQYLPTEVGQITSHEIGAPTFVGGPLRSISFFGVPRAAGQGLCERNVYYTSFDPVSATGTASVMRDVPVALRSVRKTVQIAASYQCSNRTGVLFATVQPERLLGDAKDSLSLLRNIQKQAASNSLSSKYVTCESETAENMCVGSAEKVLASLPLDRIYLIQRQEDGWRFAVAVRRPGEHFWSVTLRPPGSQPLVHLRWSVPSPF